MMKNLLKLSLFTTCLLLQAAHAETAVPVTMQKQSNSQSVTLVVQNMTCSMCKITIKKALLGVEGVEEANVDYDTKTAKVTFDPQKTTSAALVKATTDSGYPATVSQAKQ